MGDHERASAPSGEQAADPDLRVVRMLGPRICELSTGDFAFIGVEAEGPGVAENVQAFCAQTSGGGGIGPGETLIQIDRQAIIDAKPYIRELLEQQPIHAPQLPAE